MGFTKRNWLFIDKDLIGQDSLAELNETKLSLLSEKQNELAMNTYEYA